MLQQEEPGDYVLATGTKHTVREFCERAFAEVGLDYRDYCKRDERYYRPADIEALVGDARRARAELGWSTTCTFEELVGEMVETDLGLVSA